MLKKFLVSMCVFASFFCFGYTDGNIVSAQDVWIASRVDSSYRMDYYLRTETIEKQSFYYKALIIYTCDGEGMNARNYAFDLSAGGKYFRITGVGLEDLGPIDNSQFAINARQAIRDYLNGKY